MKNNSLFKKFFSLRGNARVCVYTELLWGISFNMCFQYASIYQLSLGVTEMQIGFIATVFMLSQVVFSFFSGIITDKMGRRNATTLFDFISWCIPCLIWWRAESFSFFLVAALINGAIRVPVNSLDCLMVEDVEKREIPGIYTLFIIMSQICAVFAPISSILISKLTLVPAMRILYFFAFVLMLIKLLLIYLFTKETGTGVKRIEETKGKSILDQIAGYGEVFKIILKSRGTAYSLFFAIMAGGGGIVGMINSVFWNVIVSKKLLVPDFMLPFFPIIKSMVSVFFLFFVVPRLSKGLLKLPILVSFACCFAGQLILVLIPAELMYTKYLLLGVSLILDGFGLGALAMLGRSLIAMHVNLAERARVIAIQNVIIMSVTAPFGWIGGLLSGISLTLPFIMNLTFLTAGFVTTLVYYHKRTRLPGETDTANA